MNERIDHSTRALQIVTVVEKVMDGVAGDTSNVNLPVTLKNAAREISAAQVHATLALVEQQRIANLLNLAQFESAVDEGQRLITGLEHAAALRLMASDGLGLEPGES